MTRDHQTRKVSSIKQQSLGLSQAKQRMEQIIQQQGGLTHQWYTFFQSARTVAGRIWWLWNTCDWSNCSFRKNASDPLGSGMPSPPPQPWCPITHINKPVNALLKRSVHLKKCLFVGSNYQSKSLVLFKFSRDLWMTCNHLPDGLSWIFCIFENTQYPDLRLKYGRD